MTSYHTELSQRLKFKDWLGRQFTYFPLIDNLNNDSTSLSPSISVIVEITKPDRSSFVGLKILKDLAPCPFQLVMVDNASDSPIAPMLLSLGDVRIRLNSKAGSHTARNIGAICADSPLLVFLSDAVQPHPQILQQYIQCAANQGALAMRGTVSGLQESPGTIFGRFSRTDTPHSWAMDLDENMAIDAKTFYALGGFDETQPQGYGALDLSIRIYGRYPEAQRQFHVPLASALAGDTFDTSHRWAIRQRAWHQLNEKYALALLGYCLFWVEHLVSKEKAHASLV